MPRSKQADRRSMAKIRAEFYGSPWAIDVRALGMLSESIETGDLDAVAAALSLGGECEPTTRINNGIAIIPITGVLRDEVDYMVRWGGASSYQLIERDFNQAMGNALIKGVLFYVNSPGGSAIGCKRVADLIFENRGGKPIRTYVQGMCGSAAFYIACATDRVEATADSLVGSVGTIFPHMEFSGMLKEFGYGATVFTNADSPKKGHGNIYEPLSDESRKTLQGFVDSYGRPFVNDVARYRGIKPEDVVAKYGQGDALRADVGIKQGIVDAVVENFSESLDSIIRAGGTGPSAKASNTPVVSGENSRRNTMNERIKAQLFALGLIDSLDASDAICKAALASWCRSRGTDVPADEAKMLAILQAPVKAQQEASDEEDDKEEVEDDKTADDKGGKKPANKLQQAHNAEQSEARLADLRAAASLVNEAAGYVAVTADMVLDAHEKKCDARGAMKAWNEKLAKDESPLPTGRVRVTGEGADRYGADIVDALVYRASNGRMKDGSAMKLSDAASKLINRPLWAVAAECLQFRGNPVDVYGDRELLADQAMTMGTPGARHTFFSSKENRQYIQAAGTPAARPGDFPNILSSFANKFLDTIELDDEYSYPQVSAVLPGGLSDFKPALMINKGIVEELDEVQDSEEFKQLGLSEEVLSYIFLRRFGNRWGWTPVMIANDDMGAFVEGMLGLDEAWRVTQNRLVVDRFTANEALLDGTALFANRANTGAGANPALNDNDKTSGAAPSDAEWALMEAKYADVGGIATGRRVRGALNVIYCPTGAVAQEARRTFLPLNTGGLEMKVASTTATVGLYRGEVQVIPESELRVASAKKWYALRNPTRLNTATVVRGYFNGFGEAGRRERWYDPTNKTTWVSIEGRIAVAVKNWRYAVRNAGE